MREATAVFSIALAGLLGLAHARDVSSRNPPPAQKLCAQASTSSRPPRKANESDVDGRPEKFGNTASAEPAPSQRRASDALELAGGAANKGAG